MKIKMGGHEVLIIRGKVYVYIEIVFGNLLQFLFTRGHCLYNCSRSWRLARAWNFWTVYPPWTYSAGRVFLLLRRAVELCTSATSRALQSHDDSESVSTTPDVRLESEIQSRENTQKLYKMYIIRMQIGEDMQPQTSGISQPPWSNHPRRLPDRVFRADYAAACSMFDRLFPISRQLCRSFTLCHLTVLFLQAQRLTPLPEAHVA